MQFAWIEILFIAVGVLTGRKWFEESLKPYPLLYSLGGTVAAIVSIYTLIQIVAYADNSRRYLATEWSRHRELVDKDVQRTSEEAMNRELQGELKRLSCYRGSIDGVWGDGSKQALADFLIATGNEGSFGNSVPVTEAKRLTRAAPDLVCALTNLVNQATTVKRYKQAHNAYISACQEHFLIIPYFKGSDECAELEVERNALKKKLSEMSVAIPGQ